MAAAASGAQHGSFLLDLEPNSTVQQLLLADRPKLHAGPLAACQGCVQQDQPRQEEGHKWYFRRWLEKNTPSGTVS